MKVVDTLRAQKARHLSPTYVGVKTLSRCSWKSQTLGGEYVRSIYLRHEASESDFRAAGASAVVLISGRDGRRFALLPLSAPQAHAAAATITAEDREAPTVNIGVPALIHLSGTTAAARRRRDIARGGRGDSPDTRQRRERERERRDQ